MTELAVAWATDAKYVKHVAASVHSVLSQESRAVAHLYIAPDVRPRQRRLLAKLGASLGGRLRQHDFDESLVADLPTISVIPSVMWYRILLPELLPDTDRVLYLDADTIAIASVAPLFELEMSGALVAAVENVTEPGSRDFEAELGVPHDVGYFNSGVLLMELETMRRTDSTRSIREAAETSLTWPDQDALNIALGHHRVALHPRWNAQNSLFSWTQWADDVYGEWAAEARLEPAIVHFEGHGPGTKPWDDRCQHPFRQEYLDHRRRTPWPIAPDVVTRASRRLRAVAARLDRARKRVRP